MPRSPQPRYDSVPHTPMTPGPFTPGILTPGTPGTPHYSEDFPLTGYHQQQQQHHSSEAKYSLSPMMKGYDVHSHQAMKPEGSFDMYGPRVNGNGSSAPLQDTSLLHQDLLIRDRKLKVYIRTLRLISRIILTLLTIAITVQEARTVFLFFHTRNDIKTPPGSAARGPWAQESQLWSALLLFITGVVTSLLGTVSVFAYAIGTKTANYISNLQTKFTIAVEVIHVVMWIAVATAYRVAKNGKDLWGWACSPLAENIQPTFEGVVDFKDVCDRSGVNFKLSVTNSGLQVVSLGIWILVFRRMRTQAYLKRAQMDPGM